MYSPYTRSLLSTKHSQQAEYLSHTNPPDAAQAEAHYQQALALAEELGMRPLVAHCHHGLGRLYGQIGQRRLGALPARRW